MENKTQLKDLVPLSKFNEHYDYPTVGALRILIFKNTYGFQDKCIIKIGSRLYVHIPSFEEWISETNNLKTA